MVVRDGSFARASVELGTVTWSLIVGARSTWTRCARYSQRSRAIVDARSVGLGGEVARNGRAGRT